MHTPTASRSTGHGDGRGNGKHAYFEMNKSTKTPESDIGRKDSISQELAERYRAIFDQAADAIVLIDAETGELADFNDKTHESLGYTRKEFEKLKIPEFEVIESVKEVEKHIKKITLEGTDIFETQHRTKSGDIRDVHVSCRAISIDGRDFIQGIWRDITEQKRSAAALSESENRFRKVFEEGPLGMALVGPDYGFIKVNRCFCEMLGYTEKELSALTFPDITHPEDINKGTELAEQLFKGEIPFCRIEKRYIKKNKNILWSKLTTSVIRDKNGDVLYCLAMVEDISKRKRAETDIRRSRANLQRLYERVRDIPDEERKDVYGTIHDELGRILTMLSRGLADKNLYTLHETLSDREYQILLCLAAGKTQKEIAAELSLNIKTVHTYRNRLLKKMNMKSNAELTRYAMSHNLIW